MDSPRQGITGGGLYDASGVPKLTKQAFAFPVVAGVRGGHGFVWGRVPVSHPVRVLVQRRSRNGWSTVARLSAGSDGVFDARFGARGNGLYRARVVGGPTSLAYDSRPIPPRQTHNYQVF